MESVVLPHLEMLLVSENRSRATGTKQPTSALSLIALKRNEIDSLQYNTET
jgi:hypothetical protein